MRQFTDLLHWTKLLLQAIVDVLSNTLEETNLNGWKDLQEVNLATEISENRPTLKNMLAHFF